MDLIDDNVKSTPVLCETGLLLTCILIVFEYRDLRNNYLTICLGELEKQEVHKLSHLIAGKMHLELKSFSWAC